MPKTLAKLSAVIIMALVALYSKGDHLWIGRKIWPSIDELFSDGNPDPVDLETKNIIHRKLLQVVAVAFCVLELTPFLNV